MNTIGFKNFKAFGDTMQTFSNKPITLIYGPNSVGKSSILHALMYAKEVIGGANPDIMKLDDSIDLGGFKNFIHKHDENRKFEFEREFNDFGTIASIMVKNRVCIDPSRNDAYGMFGYKKTSKFSDEFTKTKEWGYIESVGGKSFNVNEIITYAKDEKLFNEVVEKSEKRYDGNIKFLADFSKLKEWYDEILKFTFGISSVKFKTIVYNHKEKREFWDKQEVNTILYNLELYFNDELYATANFDDKKEFKYKISINQENSIFKKIADYVKYSGDMEKEKRGLLEELGKQIEYENYNIDIKDYNYFMFNLDQYSYMIYAGINELIEEFQKNKNPWLLFGEIANIWFQLYFVTNKNSNWQHIEPLRYYPERSELVFEPSHSNLSTLELNSKDIWKIITLDETNGLLNKINEWLSDENKLNTPYRIEVNKFYKEDPNNKGKILTNDYITKLEFLDIRKNTLVSPRDMGLGVSQVLPILASCYTKTYEKVDNDKQIGSNSIYIEQPELHLHPKQQCELADEFIMAVKSGKKKLYIETHSEHLLLRIMKRLRHSAQGKISKDDPLYITPDDICLIYVDNKDDGNGAYIDELKLSENGELLTPWHGGFFDESYKERFE